MQDIDRVLSTLMDEQNVTLFAIISLVLRTGITTEEICGLKIQQLVTNGQADQCGIMILGIRNRFIKVPSDLFSLLLLLSEQTDNETGNLFLTRLKRARLLSATCYWKSKRPACGPEFVLSRCSSSVIFHSFNAAQPRP